MLPGIRRRWSRTIFVGPNSDFTKDRFDIAKGELIDVALDPAICLKRSLSFPKAVQQNLAKAVDVSVKQTVPENGKDLVWRWKVRKKTKSEIQVEVYLFKKADLVAVGRSISEQKGIVRTVFVDGLKNSPVLIDNRPKSDFSVKFWGAITVLAALSCLAFFAISEARQTSELKSNLVETVSEQSELSERAVLLRQKLDQEDEAFALLNGDLSLFEAEYQRLPILLELTELLDDNVWISEFALIGANLRLSGFSTQDVPEIMAEIRALSWVSSVSLSGQINFDAISRQNRFDLLITLEAINES